VIVKIVDDETIELLGIAKDTGVQDGDAAVVPIKDPRYHHFFRGCWIRYPLVSDLLQFGNAKSIS